MKRLILLVLLLAPATAAAQYPPVTLQQAGTKKPIRFNYNFLTGCTLADNATTGATDLSCPGTGLPTTRTLTMSGPVTCDGAASCDLSANRTIAVSTCGPATGVQELAAAPGTPAEGDIYCNSTTHVCQYYDGTAWRTFSALEIGQQRSGALLFLVGTAQIANAAGTFHTTLASSATANAIATLPAGSYTITGDELANTFTAAQAIDIAGSTLTYNPGLTLLNSTASAGGSTSQYPPTLTFTGHDYYTGADKLDSWRIGVQAYGGDGVPLLMFDSNGTTGGTTFADRLYFRYGAGYNQIWSAANYLDIGVAAGSYYAMRIDTTRVGFTLTPQPTTDKGVPLGTVSARFNGVALGGTAWTAVTLSAGWGSTASVVYTKASDPAGTLTITASGTGQAANPTITFNWKDGTKTNAPVCHLAAYDATTPANIGQVIATTAAASTGNVWTWFATPTANDVVTVTWICVNQGA